MECQSSSLLLNTGARIPQVGLGTWKSKVGEVENAVKCALSNGYRLIDCAFAYSNEKEVGSAIQQCISQGIVKRQDIFVTTKLAPNFNKPDNVEEACKTSLQNLGLDYVDLYLMHWPVALKDGKPLDIQGEDICFTSTYKAMEPLVKKGYTKAIGVSNFNKSQLEKVWSICQVKPAVNQVEVHPYLTNDKLAELCKEKGIVVMAHCPFASPDPGRPTRTEKDPEPLQDPVINEIAAKNKVSAAQVIVKWLVQRGLVTIPKSVTPQRIVANIQIQHLMLTSEEMEKLNSLNIPFRAAYGAPFVKSKYYPFNDDY